MVSPVEPFEGPRYVEPIYNEGQVNYLDQIYNVTAMHEDHISPTTDGNPARSARVHVRLI